MKRLDRPFGISFPLAFFLPLLLFPSGVLLPQGRTVRILNEGYSVRLHATPSGDVAVVEGFVPGIGDDPLPSRRVEIELLPGEETVSLESVEYGTVFPALPFYTVSWELNDDSALAPVYRVRDAVPLLDTAVTILDVRRLDRGGQRIVEVRVPLFAVNPAKVESRWVNAYRFVLIPAGRERSSVQASAGRGGYFTQPFIRKSLDLDTSGAWIPASREAVRFDVNKDGIYMIDARWLRTAGVEPAALDPTLVRLFWKGREIPLFTVGMEDGKFDEGDIFIFAGERNYDERGYRRVPESLDDPYPQYFNKYSDSAAYWLTFADVPGRRMQVLVTPEPVQADTVDWAFHCFHSEPENWLFALSTDYVRQQFCEWGADKTWFHTWMRTGTARFPFPVDHLKPDMGARVWQKSGSWASSASQRPYHRVSVAVNDGPPLDTVEYDVNWQGLCEGRCAPRDIRNGTNMIAVTNEKLYEGDNALYLDWFDIEYPRFLVAGGGAFSFSVDREMGSGLRVFRVDSLAGDSVIIVRKRGQDFAVVSPLGKAPGGAGTLWFADSLVEGTMYFIAGWDSLPSPSRGRLRRVPDLRATDHQAAYLVITAEEFIPEAEQYASFIANRYGVGARVVAVEDIYDNYSFGVFNPEAIKLFLFDAVGTWSSDPLRYVFLVGDANYNYKAAPTPHTRNFVPSYGFPVSDIWLVSFDSLSIEPACAVGRLPVHSGAEILAYLDKHARMLALEPDEWDKTTLHFSGGTNNLPQEKLDELKRMNDAIIREVVMPAPFAGNPIHFYKTRDPATDFGPYPIPWVHDRIAEGGIAISYFGHAAIRTWDNTIGDPSQLFNTKDRTPIVSDFGCSTSKFADPDGVSFAEQFVVPPGTQAIGYVGNAAIGFTTTASVIGLLYYEALLKNGYTAIGDAHRQAKFELTRRYGVSLVNRVAIQSNTLVGDPIARLPVPTLPDPVVRSSWIIPEFDVLTTTADSAVFRLAIGNFGTSTQDSVTILARDIKGNDERIVQVLRRPLPKLFDTLRISVPLDGEAGTHTLRIELDPEMRIVERSEKNNVAELSFSVLSTHLLTVNAAPGRVTGGWPDVRILHPMLSPGEVTHLLVEFDTVPDFPSPFVLRVPYGKTQTPISAPPSLVAGKRYYWRARLDREGAQFIGALSFRTDSVNAVFIQQDSTEFAGLERENTLLLPDGVTIAPGYRTLRVISSGYNDGNYGTVELDGVNILPTTFGRGYYVAVLDSIGITVDTVAGFDTYMNPDVGAEFAQFVRSVPFGKIIAISTMDDPFAYNPLMVSALHEIGSLHADSLLVYQSAYRGSFAIIGRRGAARGTVPEAFRPQFQGKVMLDTLYAVDPDTARIISGKIGPAARWSRVFLRRTPVRESEIDVRIYGVTESGENVKLIEKVNVVEVDIGSIDAAKYPMIRLETVLVPSRGNATQPVLRGWGVVYDQRPELALNYQSVSLSKDTVLQGEAVTVSIGVVNAGETPAPPFRVRVDATAPDNTSRTIALYRVGRLPTDGWHDTTITFQTASFAGTYRVNVRVDDDDQVREQYETNNTLVSILHVLRDTVPPVLEVYFDGGPPPVDGDYIRPDPEILLRLRDMSPLPVTEASRFLIFLDDTAVSTAGLPFVPMGDGRPAELLYRPSLPSGEHVFRFNALDASGNRSMVEDLRVRVLVDRTDRIVSLTTYPNPYTSDAVFLFTFAGVSAPEEARIKLYTTAGRLIRTILIPADQLRIGMNAYRWDGRDEEGDPLANGVYFYKLQLRTAHGTMETIGRLVRLQ
ncbi:MAG: C25 family cysteine peptidase [Bacteroidota bacterium]|nr:C25 family cysteine peptidase [Bacteroidota bacterium]